MDQVQQTAITNLQTQQMPQHTEYFTLNYDARLQQQQQQQNFNNFYVAQNYAYMQPQPHYQTPMMLSPVDAPKQTKTKRTRTVYTSHQLSELEREFASNQFLYSTRRMDIAKSLNLCERQVKIWFQNRRIKQKRINSGQQSSKVRYSGNQRQQPQQEIVQRLMSYTHEAPIPTPTNQLQQKTPTIAEYNIKIEVLDPDFYQVATQPITQYDLNLVKMEPTPMPAINTENIECIDLTDVMDYVNSDATTSTDIKTETLSAEAPSTTFLTSSSPSSTSSTVSVSDWFTREDVIAGIQRELELSAEQYAATGDDGRQWQFNECKEIAEQTLVNVDDVSSEVASTINDIVDITAVSTPSSEACSTDDNVWSISKDFTQEVPNFDLGASLMLDDKPKITEIIDLTAAGVFSY